VVRALGVVPVEIATVCGSDEKRMVELLDKSWNRLKQCIRQGQALVKGYHHCTPVHSAADPA
jgi:hypothetical protein